MKLFTRTCHALMLALILTSIPALAQQQASFEPLDPLSVTALSPNGLVVVGTCSRPGDPPEACMWVSGEIIGLGQLPDALKNGSWANDVSADGSIVVGQATSSEAFEAVRWVNGEIESLGFLTDDSFESNAQGISADGSVIIGLDVGPNGAEGFRWEDGKMIGLGYLPNDDEWPFSIASDISADGSVIVGSSPSGNTSEAFRWENGEMTGLGFLSGEPPDPDWNIRSGANSVSSDGSIVVGQSSSSNGYEAFLWKDGEMMGLGALPGVEFGSVAYAVSADGGVVVGLSVTEIMTGEAFIWTPADGMRNLKEVLENDWELDLTGWVLGGQSSQRMDISDDGTVIVGNGVSPEGISMAWRAVIPRNTSDEPSPHAAANVLSVPYPNPTREAATLTITVERGQTVSVEVFDVMGRRIQTIHTGVIATGTNETLTLDVRTLPAGSYLIRAVGEDFVQTQRLTVVR